MPNEGSYEAAKRRSDEVHADLLVHPEKYTMLTGDRPTGRLHLGHYFGTLVDRVRLQDMGVRTNVIIADYQVITDRDTTEHIRDNVYNMVIDYLACGIDPAKTMIFTHSAVPELNQLMLPFLSLVTEAEMERNPTVKAEIQQKNFEASIPVGFFTYPISQAADITAFKATTVPVGEDQLPMLEQTKEIVRKFNSVYGDTLVEPDILLPDNKACLRLPGTDGKAKMSKSLNNCIYLSDPEEEVRKKVMSMFTDPNHLQVSDPGQVEGNPVFIYLDAFCKDDMFAEYLPEYSCLQELKDHYTRGGLGDVKVKKFLNNVLQEQLSPIRTSRKEWEQRIPDIYEILHKGSMEAEEVAAKTLDDVKKSMKINYFDDHALIAEQADRYKAE